MKANFNNKAQFKKPEDRNKEESNYNLKYYFLDKESAQNRLNAQNNPNPSSNPEIKEDDKQKIKKPRFKLDEKSLLYSENGIKKFYELLEKTSFRENATEVSLLYISLGA